jgi:hypothetical protein
MCNRNITGIRGLNNRYRIQKMEWWTGVKNCLQISIFSTHLPVSSLSSAVIFLDPDVWCSFFFDSVILLVIPCSTSRLLFCCFPTADILNTKSGWRYGLKLRYITERHTLEEELKILKFITVTTMSCNQVAIQQ